MTTYRLRTHRAPYTGNIGTFIFKDGLSITTVDPESWPVRRIMRLCQSTALEMDIVQEDPSSSKVAAGAASMPDASPVEPSPPPSPPAVAKRRGRPRKNASKD